MESQSRREEVYAATSEQEKTTAAFLKVQEMELQWTTKNINSSIVLSHKNNKDMRTGTFAVDNDGGVHWEELVQLTETYIRTGYRTPVGQTTITTVFGYRRVTQSWQYGCWFYLTTTIHNT